MSQVFEHISINAEGAPEIDPTELNQKLGVVRIVDVRKDDEYVGELSHIQGAELVTLGPDLEKYLESQDKSQTYVFVCRSGGRSTSATLLAKEKGFEKVFNMKGGMLRWNAMGLPTSQ